MKCKCSRCNGYGEIECPDCEGEGIGDEISVGAAKLNPEMENYEELKALQDDARRLRRQTERLIELKPEREKIYREQLAACLTVVEGQANELCKEAL